MHILKTLALSAIRLGKYVPENPISRLQEPYHFYNLLDSLQINCVLDVGANRGQFAVELRNIGYRGSIISFEPSERDFLVLQEHFKQDPKWTGHQVGLGAARCVKQLNVYPQLTVMNSLLEMRRPWLSTTVEEIEMHRLDELLPSILPDGLAPRIFLKMDTQGYDLTVFDGATGCLNKVFGLQSELCIQPIYEHMPQYVEALSVYEKAGFELYNLSVVSRLPRGGLQEMNCFMKRRDG